jgi:plastocyanin
MFFSTKLAAFAAVLSLVAIPARSADIAVTVGGKIGDTDTIEVAYTPEFVTANVGDTIVFTFKQLNHTVTQSSFDDPCSPLTGGFDSGFVPVATNATEFLTTATFTVNDTSPVWVYCRQTGHCQKGMVFAINPGAGQFSTFQARANGTLATTSSITSVSFPSSTATSSPASSTAMSVDHAVTVGGPNGLVYTPSNITANPGDTVTFHFEATNHTATQSAFAVPCEKLALTSTSGQVGFDSGFMPVSANATVSPTYTIQVNDTKPIWVYCRQTGHCGKGMVFSVNAPETGNTFAAFQAAAIQQNGTASNSTKTNNGASRSNVGLGGFGVALIAAGVGLAL